MQISLYGPSIKPALWKGFYGDVSRCNVEFEVVFSGPLDSTLPQQMGLPQNFRYIHTENIKPVQCFQVSALNTVGEVICLCADDESFSPGALDNAYRLYKEVNNPKAIIGLTAIFGGSNVMWTLRYPYDAPGDRQIQIPPGFSLMNRDFFLEVGGYDTKYVRCYAELDMFLRSRAHGAEWLVCDTAFVYEDFGGWTSGIDVHSNTDYYYSDRAILDQNWIDNGTLRTTAREFSPYPNDESIYQRSFGAVDLNRWV